MKRKDAIKALEETLNKWEGLGEHCKLGIIHDFRKELIIQKYGIKPPVIHCIDLNEEPIEDLVQKIKDHLRSDKRFFRFVL